MVDKTLTNILTANPVTTALDGSEPLETVVAGVSEAARIRQLSFIPTREVTTEIGTVTNEDQGRVIAMNRSTANTLMIALNATEQFPLHGTLLVRQTGIGATSVAGAAGVTVTQKASNSPQIAERYGQVVLHKIGENIWHMAGEFLAL